MACSVPGSVAVGKSECVCVCVRKQIEVVEMEKGIICWRIVLEKKVLHDQINR